MKAYHDEEFFSYLKVKKKKQKLIKVIINYLSETFTKNTPP